MTKPTNIVCKRQDAGKPNKEVATPTSLDEPIQDNEVVVITQPRRHSGDKNGPFLISLTGSRDNACCRLLIFWSLVTTLASVISIYYAIDAQNRLIEATDNISMMKLTGEKLSEDLSPRYHNPRHRFAPFSETARVSRKRHSRHRHHNRDHGDHGSRYGSKKDGKGRSKSSYSKEKYPSAQPVQPFQPDVIMMDPESFDYKKFFDGIVPEEQDTNDNSQDVLSKLNPFFDNDADDDDAVVIMQIDGYGSRDFSPRMMAGIQNLLGAPEIIKEFHDMLNPFAELIKDSEAKGEIPDLTKVDKAHLLLKDAPDRVKKWHNLLHGDTYLDSLLPKNADNNEDMDVEVDIDLDDNDNILDVVEIISDGIKQTAFIDDTLEGVAEQVKYYQDEKEHKMKEHKTKVHKMKEQKTKVHKKKEFNFASVLPKNPDNKDMNVEVDIDLDDNGNIEDIVEIIDDGIMQTEFMADSLDGLAEQIQEYQDEHFKNLKNNNLESLLLTNIEKEGMDVEVDIDLDDDGNLLDIVEIIDDGIMQTGFKDDTLEGLGEQVKEYQNDLQRNKEQEILRNLEWSKPVQDLIRQKDNSILRNLEKENQIDKAWLKPVQDYDRTKQALMDYREDQEKEMNSAIKSFEKEHGDSVEEEIRPDTDFHALPQSILANYKVPINHKKVDRDFHDDDLDYEYDSEEESEAEMEAVMEEAAKDSNPKDLDFHGHNQEQVTKKLFKGPKIPMEDFEDDYKYDLEEKKKAEMEAVKYSNSNGHILKEPKITMEDFEDEYSDEDKTIQVIDNFLDKVADIGYQWKDHEQPDEDDSKSKKYNENKPWNFMEVGGPVMMKQDDDFADQYMNTAGPNRDSEESSGASLQDIMGILSELKKEREGYNSHNQEQKKNADEYYNDDEEAILAEKEYEEEYGEDFIESDEEDYESDEEEYEDYGEDDDYDEEESEEYEYDLDEDEIEGEYYDAPEDNEIKDDKLDDKFVKKYLTKKTFKKPIDVKPMARKTNNLDAKIDSLMHKA